MATHHDHADLSDSDDDIVMGSLLDDLDEDDTPEKDEGSGGEGSDSSGSATNDCDADDEDEVSATNDCDADDEDEVLDEVPMRPMMTLRQRRHSLLSGRPIPNLNQNINNTIPELNTAVLPHSARGNWMRALRKIPNIEDPWKQFNLLDLPTEVAVRHRYNALKKRWIQDDVQVKMETKPFNHGAMRSCFRLKKLSSFSHSHDWNNASNYVAKIYMEDVSRDVYFEDVKLQMDAKLWGEEYDRHNPPKKVDIFQMSVLQFTERPDQPLYHLEHFIEGHYIKYNSNSGFVDESLRLTPQAFSHFTFERSGHQLIIVDIQGVGDLWTDPQIHTNDGEGYGDGNLGPRGMALFFHSHICNTICKSLNLSKFDLAPSEMLRHNSFIHKQRDSRTVVRGMEEVCISASPTDKTDLHAMLLHRRSRGSTGSSFSQDSGSDDEPMSPLAPLSHPPFRMHLASCSESEPDSNADTLSKEEEQLLFQNKMLHLHRPSSVANELNLLNRTHIEALIPIDDDSILGQIHHDLAKYHELGRFVDEDEPVDWDAALFHEVQAAQCGIIEAILTLARLYLGMPREVLVDCTVQDNDKNIDRGLSFMELAARCGDRSSMIYMAQTYEAGSELGNGRQRSYDQAAMWYQKAIEKASKEEDGDYDATMDTPIYALKARMAELYLNGGYDLDADPSYSGELYTEAAEEAMAAMKGRLANKYYSLAEEAWALVEE